MSASIQVFKEKAPAKVSIIGKSKGFIAHHKKWLLGILGCLVLILAGVFAYYFYLQQTITTPTIQPIDSIINSDLVLKSEQDFVVEINNNNFYATKKADNLYEVETKLNDGEYTYKVNGVFRNRLLSIKSKNSQIYSVKVDATKPELLTNNILAIYNEPKQKLEIETSEPTQLTINDKDLECTDETTLYKCDFEFTNEGRQTIAIKLTDEANNTDNFEFETLFTLKPTLDCGQNIPTTTQQPKVNLECKVNKEGSLFVGEKEIDVTVNAPLPIEIPLPAEGKNTAIIRFKDTYGLEAILEISVNKDSIAPIANFNFLDSKKIFQQGTVAIGFISNENAKVKVKFYPINNFFETDQLAKQILGSGNFVYEGGQTFEADITAGQQITYSTPNNFALCQVLSASNKNCFSPGVVGIEVILSDTLGNSRTYICNNWLATDTAKLEGLEATTCQERK